MGSSVYLWLYYLAFSLAWFLVGLMFKPYASTITKLAVAGTTGLLRLVGMGHGTATMGDFNSHWEHGELYMGWDFPRTPPNVSRYTAPISSGNAMEDYGANGPTHLESAV